MNLRTALTAVGAACLLLAAGLSLSPLRFAMSAVQTQANVVAIEAQNAVCEKHQRVRRDETLREKRRRQYDCTRYRAEVRFQVDGREIAGRLFAGDAPGHDQPSTLADHRVGDRLDVTYRASHPEEVYPADASGALQRWGGPLIASVFGLCLLWVGRRGGNSPATRRT